MLKLPIVSFIVTSFNYEKYIGETLESIKEQTYQNFEIIVVDDCSEDNSICVVEKFMNENKSIKTTLIKHERNFGQLAAFQSGLKSAQGQFVSFIDSDDVLMKDFAETLIDIHLKVSVAMASAQLVEIDENDVIHAMQSPSGVRAPKKSDKLFDVITTHTKPFGGWYWSPSSSAMFRRSAIDLILNYSTPEDWRVCPDKFLFNFAHLVGGSALVYMPLTAYRRHGKNAGKSDVICGCRRYNRDETNALNIKNNKIIRRKTIDFIEQNRTKFDEKFGKRNVDKMIFKIRLSYLDIPRRLWNYLFS